MTETSIAPEATLIRVESDPGDIRALGVEVAGRILFQVFLINAFERRVVELKDDECINGPIHVSIGQEALAAATMAALGSRDRIAGSHRAHHQFLAKALNHVSPAGWNPSSTDPTAQMDDVVRRTLAEIMGLADGYCGGRGGSMHLRWAEAGVLGTNAIVSGGVPLATGSAYAERARKSGNVVVVFLGDGGVNQGSFHESLNMAACWSLPIIYFIENNQYAVATAAADVSAVENLAQIGLGVNLESRIILGYDVPAIYHTVDTLARSMREGAGPAIVEARCYRHVHHGGGLKGSQYGYRPTEEEDEWLSRDAYTTLPEQLVSNEMLTEENVEAIRRRAEGSVTAAFQWCATSQNGSLVVPADRWPDPATAADGMRSSGSELQALPYVEPNLRPESRVVKFSDAIAEVTGRWLERDPQAIVIGEEVANFGGGAYGATRGLPSRFPDRVVNTPISEGGFSGLALGMAMSGMRPVVEIMFADFALVAADQIFNQIAKARHMYGGTTDIPLVLRTRVATGAGYGGQHSMDPVGLYALFSGWRIVAPADSGDYIGLFNTAMHSLDPVVILEYHSIYSAGSPVPDDLDYCIPFGKARILHSGTDITVLSYGGMTSRLLDLVPRIEECGISAEVIDLRTLDLLSLDFETVGDSLARTGVVAVVEQAAAGLSIGRRIVSEVTERFFDELDAPPGCIAAMDVPNSVSRVLEAAAMIGDDEIVDLLVRMGRRTWK